MSLKERLERYLRKQHGLIAKATICDIARAATGATGEHTGRRLRELENDKKIKVVYIKGHAHYQIAQTPEQWFAELA